MPRRGGAWDTAGWKPLPVDVPYYVKPGALGVSLSGGYARPAPLLMGFRRRR